MANASSSVPAHTIVFSKFVFSLRILDPKYQNVFLTSEKFFETYIKVNLLRRVLITLIKLTVY